MAGKAAVWLAIGGWALLALAQEAAEAPPNPRTVGLVERAESRLAQIDVTLIGSPDAIGDLTAEDFRIKVHLKNLKDFTVDRICQVDGERAVPEATEDALPTEATQATYLFYFDQPHLTLAGRQRALDMAAVLIDRLVAGGRRAMIISNAARLKLISPMTNDVEALKGALKELENDREQWDFFAEQERVRIDEVVRMLNEDEDVQRAVVLARLYQKEERWRTERNLRRLEMALGQLSELESPKAVVYFADTMRSNPGEHYLSFFGTALRRTDSAVGAMSADSLTAHAVFDRVLKAASARGIRFYTVEAQGLTTQFDLSHLNPKAYTATGTVSSNSRVRAADAQQALGDLASETGGRSFLHGVGASRIASRVLEDLACRYLVSFDPSAFREDVSYRVSVEVKRKGVEVRSRGMIVFPSKSTRLTSRLLHAFGSAGEIDDAFAVRVGLVPIEYDRNSYRALLQISVPATPLPGASWDLGATILARNEVREEISGRIQVGGPGVPVVLEKEVELKPGAQRIVSVAHESRTGLVASEEITIDWPAPGDESAVLTPIALVQPARGAFLRDEESRTRGSLAQGESDQTRVGRPAALIGLVCRSRKQKGQFRVERRLIGRSTQSFPPLTLDLAEDRCAQVRDLLPAGSLIPGYYRYEIRVFDDETLLQEQSRDFYAAPAPVGAPLPTGNPAGKDGPDGG